MGAAWGAYIWCGTAQPISAWNHTWNSTGHCQRIQSVSTSMCMHYPQLQYLTPPPKGTTADNRQGLSTGDLHRKVYRKRTDDVQGPRLGLARTKVGCAGGRGGRTYDPRGEGGGGRGICLLGDYLVRVTHGGGDDVVYRGQGGCTLQQAVC